MRRAALGLVVTATTAACATAPSAPTLSASPTKIHYSFITVGRPAGEADLAVDADGTRRTHFTYNDRGRGPDISATTTLDERGAVKTFRAIGHDYFKARVDETVETASGEIHWRSTGEEGHAAAAAGFFLPFSGPMDASALLAQALLRAPGHKLPLLPAGSAWIADDTKVTVNQGGTPLELRRIAIAGIDFQPGLVWLGPDGQYFGEVSPWGSTIRAGSEGLIPTLIAEDQKWRDAHSAGLAASLSHKPPAAGLAIVHARLFDSQTKKIVPDATVVVVGDKIAAAGDATTKIPAGAQVIDAHGRTLIPGLWDMHVHLSDGDGALHLAAGVTTVRDLGNDIDQLTGFMTRFDAGTEIGPHILRAGLIDGPGPLAAPTGVLADTADKARAAVERFFKLGYVQIKIYSSIKPELVPVIAQAAHAHNLRVSGHIPSGMNAAEAVESGYDEIQHVNFLFLRFLAGPGDDTRTPLRFTRVAEKGADLDLDGKDVKEFIDLLVAKKTVIDPTLSAFEDMFVADPGQMDPVLTPYVGRLPAQIERGAKRGGLPAPGGRAKFRASYQALLRMVKKAWDRGVTVVAGTDGIAGISLARELELYVQAGIPAADVLALATLGSARVMRIDSESGSITPGKRADLVLLDGDPLSDIGAVRRTDVVVCRGVVYDPAELFASTGMTGHK